MMDRKTVGAFPEKGGLRSQGPWKASPASRVRGTPYHLQGASVIDADGRRFIIEAETIVFAIEAEANRDVWQQVRHIAAVAYLIGDVLRPRNIREAILEGHRVGHRLSLSHRENP
jgi:hypothetical protein